VSDTIQTETNQDLAGEVAAAGAKLAATKHEVASLIFGQDEVIEQALTVLLAGGHMLLIGVPGLAKTRLVSALSKALGLDTKRIQCTPDLMPTDIVGAEILEEVDYGRRNFRFIQGPIFCQFLMVDEINRASPRTQSALLQAMEEMNVTVTGREHALPVPFHVLATQNPLEQEGTYPLPEAQLDRFLMQIDISYPNLEAERRIVESTMNEIEIKPKTVIYANDLRDMQKLVRAMPLSDKAIETTLALVRAGRPETTSLDIVKKYVSWGPGPRASRALGLLMRARALTQGRMAPTMEDLTALLRPTLRHRMALNYMARTDGVTLEDVLAAIVKSVPAF